MKKILMFYTGKNCNPGVYDTLGKDFDVTQIYMADHVQPDQNHIRYLDLSDESAIDLLLEDIFPADAVLILPSVSSRENPPPYDAFKEMQLSLFSLLKVLYPNLMRLKGTTLWILEPVFDAEGASAESVRIAQKGVMALSQVAAMELARKKVAVNYLGKGNGYSDIDTLIKWAAERKKIYMTAQVLNA
ncbi:MAG: hypothetical protein V6Z89_19795 [Desulfobacter sp.]